ncbi:hypothetical protein ACP70R_042507 [Stipagrostis hirtigluma subsp. patula]
MPSKRPPPRAMDEADAAAAAAAAARPRASASRSNKRSSRSKSRSRDRRRRRSPNPNPSPRRDRGGGASAPWRKSDRKRRPRSIPDSATLAAAMASAAAASSGGGGRGAAQKLWSDADEVALLTGALDFKERTGAAPRLPDMGDLFNSIRDSLAPHLDQAKMYYKLKRLKSKFQHSAPGATSTPHELRVRDLSADLWGAELAGPVAQNAGAEDAEEADADEGYTGGDEDVAAGVPILREVLGEHWRMNGRVLSGVSLEKGLALLGPEEAGVAEAKWRRQLEAEMRTQMRRQDLGKEVFGLLIDAVKGLGP